MKKSKKVLLLILVFLSFLFLNLFVNQLQNDEIWNYGFAYNIYKGLIPYKDFNMVLTPFYPFFISLFFYVFGDSILTFHIFNALMLTGLSYLLYKMIGEKVYILGVIMLLFSNATTSPGYNVFLLCLICIIYYMEKNEGNDYIIGLLIGISILTKQSVGFFLLLPSFYYLKEKTKLFHRAIGVFVPCCIFLIFLLWNHIVSSFLDLCLFGLFDFGTMNSSKSILSYISFVLYYVFCILLLKKNTKKIDCYYALAFGTMMIPLFDLAHSIGPYLFLLTVFLMNHKISLRIKPLPIFIVCYIAISMISIVRYHNGYKIIYPNNITHFKWRLIREDSLALTNQVKKYVSNHKKEDIVFLNSSAYYFRLITDTPITYIDMTNNGNFGYHGSDKIIQEIKKHKNALVFINMDEYEHGRQTNKKSIEYVINHGEKIDKLWIFDIYKLQ